MAFLQDQRMNGTLFANRGVLQKTQMSVVIDLMAS